MIDIAPFTLDAKPAPTQADCRRAADGVRAAVDLLNEAQQNARKIGLDVRLQWCDGWQGRKGPDTLTLTGYWEAQITQTL